MATERDGDRLIGLAFDRPLRSVTCLGAHPDDIEIGCAALLLRLAGESPETSFRFVVLTSDDRRAEEARQSAVDLLGERVEIALGGFEDGYLPYRQPGVVKDFLVGAVDPAGTDLVLAPRADDLHQDHRFVAELALQVFRRHLILGYEIPKYDGDLGPAQLYLPISSDEVEVKLTHLEQHFVSQHTKPWYARDVFSGLLALRGAESGGDGYAEAYQMAKARLG
ncbi:MAG: PIG-L family deacetylase [Acidimicrobiia bacterium]